MEYHYTAIVLGKRDVGEADRVYVLYTREGGKIRAMARGVRKPHARLAAQLENFHSSRVIVMRSQGVGNIKSASIEGERIVLHSSLDAIEQAFLVAHFFEKRIEWEEPDSVLFDKLQEYFFVLNELAISGRLEKASVLSGAFLFKVLAHLGHTLELGRCVISGEEISPGDHYISLEQGGIVGPVSLNTKHFSDLRKLSLENIKFMRLALLHPLSSIVKISIGDQHIRAFLLFLKEYQERVFR